MKKHFTTFLMSAATMLVAIAFTACSSEDVDDPIIKKTTKTIFSMEGDDGTRTSIDKKANFYWEKGDKIWIDGGTGFEWSSQSNITTTKQAKAKFVVDGTYTENEYKVLYTGYANGDTTQTFYNKVTIAHQQTQKAWNDGSHLGTSGDCGTGIAYKQTGAPGYKFTIDHKASYLLLYPYVHTDMSGYTLEKVEVYSDLSATPIAGTFTFDFNNGLLNADGTPKTPQNGTAKQEITLNCDGGFQLSQDVPNVTSTTTFRHLFVVIAPGTHQLTIKYYAKNASNQSVEFIKDLAITKYEPNGVYPYIHQLKDAIVNYGFQYYENSASSSRRYRWGMTEPAVSGGAVIVNNQATQVTDDFWADIPNVAAATWYMKAGMYWDSSTEWTILLDNGTQRKFRGGVWLKKWAYIPNRNTTTSSGITAAIPRVGRPDASEINQWFFIPAISADGVVGSTDRIRIWNSQPHDATIAYAFDFAKTYATCGALYGKGNVWLCYPLSVDGTPWFQ